MEQLVEYATISPWPCKIETLDTSVELPLEESSHSATSDIKLEDFVVKTEHLSENHPPFDTAKRKMKRLVGHATISPCKIETLDKSVELPLEDSSHSATSNIKLEDFVVETEHLSDNYPPFDTAKRIKLEEEDKGDESLFESHSHSDISGKFDDQMKTEIISSGPSQVPTFIQELVYIDRDDQRCKMDCEVSIHSSGSGSHDMVAAATVEDGQADLPTDNHFENSDKGVHEDILPSAQDISNRSCNPHEKKKLYKCSERDKECTTTMLNLQKHIRTQSVKKSYKCPTCEKTFSKKGTLDFHITTHSGEKQYGCVTCGKTFCRKSILDGHIKTHTGEKPYSCFECGSGFSIKSSLLRHIRIHTGEKPYECCTCGRTFSTKYVLKRHIKVHTGEKPYCCLTCGKTFPRKSTLDIHIRNHTGETPSACTDCDNHFENSDKGVHEDILPSAQDISTHTCNPHETKFYKCSERDKECTTTMLNLQKHIRTHTGEKPYGSLTCGKTFSRKFVLDGHIKTHTGEKPYSCFECGSAFSQKSNLLRHIKTHTGEKQYECHTCGRTFSTNYVLKRHIKVHTGEKPHCCLTCGKTFPRKSTLDIHIRNHTGETPYACTDCGKEYKTSSSLFYHMKTHATEKMYGCDICGRRFNQKCTLTCHIRVHSREKIRKK